MKNFIGFTSVFFSLALFAGIASAEDWPAFRGSRGGVSADKNLPAQLSKDNILFKIKLPGPGASSPITYDGKVYVSCYSGYGTKLTKGFGRGGFGGFGRGGFGGRGKGGFGRGGFGRGGADNGAQKKLRLHLICLDGKKGKILWQKDIKPKLPEQSFTNFIREHGYASSTPVTDGRHIYAFFGKTGVLCFDMKGTLLWQKSVGTRTDMWGTAASPILYKDLVIVNAAIESRSLVALNKKTGKEVWRIGGLGKSWASPLLVKTKDGKHEVVVSIPGKVAGYDPQKGTELWHCRGIGSGRGFGYTCSTPVASDGIVYVIGGGGPTPSMALAVKTGGRGDVDSTHVLWRKRAGTAISSPVLSGGGLCWVSGTVECLDTKTGKRIHSDRLYGGFNEYVSAVAAGNTLYALTRFNGLYVLGVGDKLEKLDHFEFTGDDSIFNASPAISNNRLYIRSNEYLYCIGNKSDS